MQKDRGKPHKPEPWRAIEEDQVVLAFVAFLMAHPACEEAVKLTREGSSVVCWCELCEDLRTYQVVKVLDDI